MPKPKPKPKPILSRAEVFLVRLCLFLAFGISVYLAWNSLQGGAIPGCGPESNCDKVLSSRWAYVFGWPVSLFAAPVYAVMLGLLLQREPRWRLLLAGSVVILGAALWFVGIQFFVLRAFCKFCMAAHIAGSIAAIVLLRRNPVPAQGTVTWAALGGSAAALLIVAQALSKPPSAQTTEYASAPAVIQATNSGSTSPVPATAAAPEAAPTFGILGGKFELNLTEVPVHGKLDAPKKVVKLFDYTCHHCRDMHHQFQPLLAAYTNQLAVISLVMPLDADCNRLMKQTPRAHQNACEYAKLGLAVFVADPEKSHTFDDWIFGPPVPPDLAQARQYAETLVGTQALAQALIDPRVEAHLARNVDIYYTNSTMAKNSRMPQLLFKEGTTIGSTSSQQDLLGILVKSVGLQTNHVNGN